jgi:hypothetical protein
MILAAKRLTWLAWVSYELFAEAISRPSTRAAIVPMSPVHNRTTSFVFSAR